jgi:hypothetical protein
MYNKQAMKEIETLNNKGLEIEEMEIELNKILEKYSCRIEIIETLSNGIQKLRAVDKDGLVVSEWHTVLIKVNGAWYVDQLPTMIVIELEDGSLKMFYMSPLKPVRQENLKDYKGYHPRKMKGQPLPAYLYRFYGLEKSDETLSEVFRVRISPSEFEKIKTAADSKDKTVADFFRDWISTL